jgi:hypothetical protein
MAATGNQGAWTPRGVCSPCCASVNGISTTSLGLFMKSRGFFGDHPDSKSGAEMSEPM